MLRLIALCLFLYGASVLAVAVSIYRYGDPDPIPPAGAIVVLSGPGADVTGTEGETLERVDRGIALYNAGVAPFLVLTGGVPTEGATSHAENMAARAAELGVPVEAVRLEPAAKSTLQNAWFTKGLNGVDPEGPVVVVSHRYHLLRAWASFRWAGFSDLTLVAADPEGGVEISGPLLLEGVKWPFNVLRAAVASAALAAGAEEAQVLPWLR